MTIQKPDRHEIDFKLFRHNVIKITPLPRAAANGTWFFEGIFLVRLPQRPPSPLGSGPFFSLVVVLSFQNVYLWLLRHTLNWGKLSLFAPFLLLPFLIIFLVPIIPNKSPKAAESASGWWQQAWEESVFVQLAAFLAIDLAHRLVVVWRR